MIKYKKIEKRYSIMNEGEIQAVHDDDIETLLSSLGFFEKYKTGKLKCMFCGVTINFENFQCIVPQNDEIQFCCSDEKCYSQLIDFLKKGE